MARPEEKYSKLSESTFTLQQAVSFVRLTPSHILKLDNNIVQYVRYPIQNQVSSSQDVESCIKP